MRAVIFNGSLKPDQDDSNTQKVIDLAVESFQGWGVQCSLRYLRDYRIAPGVTFDTGDAWDEAKPFYADIEKADIVIIATPIWWGIQSSLVSALMERIGAYDDDYILTSKSKLYDKVFGCIITGSNDGFQHVQGNLYAFASNLGMTIPPEAHVTWGTSLRSKDDPSGDPETVNMIKNATRNLFMWSKAIKGLQLGTKALDIKPGRVGLLVGDELRSSE